MRRKLLGSILVTVLFFAGFEGRLSLAGVATPLPEGGLVLRKARSAPEPDTGEADPGGAGYRLIAEAIAADIMRLAAGPDAGVRRPE